MTLHSFAKLVKFNTFYDVWAVENRLQLAQKGYEELVPIYKILPTMFPTHLKYMLYCLEQVSTLIVTSLLQKHQVGEELAVLDVLDPCFFSNSIPHLARWPHHTFLHDELI